MTRFVRSVVLLTALLGGCTVGPDYQPAPVASPDHWTEGVAPSADRPDPARWWRGFNDATLDRLVDQAVAGNLDLKMAAQRIVAARADRVVVAARDLPHVGAGLSAANSRSSESLTWPPGNGEYKTYGYGLEASWEIDVFGGTARALEASDAGIDAAVEDRRAVMVALLGDLAADYATLRSSQHRLQIAHDNIAAETGALHLSERAFAGGLGTDMDVARARAAVEASEAQVPHLNAAVARMSHAIAVLLGRFPGDLKDELAAVPIQDLRMPGLPDMLPSEVVRNRPDIRRAERRIAAATARIGVATAELFPHFSIPLGLTPMASNLVNLFDPSSLVWTFGVSVSQTVYDGGRARAQIRAAEALAEHDRLAYQQAVLSAFRDVEDHLVGLASERQRHQSLIAAASDERRAFERASQLYANGLTDFLKVLDSERALFRAEDGVAESEWAQQIELIGLYRALGGGWQEADVR